MEVLQPEVKPKSMSKDGKRRWLRALRGLLAGSGRLRENSAGYPPARAPGCLAKAARYPELTLCEVHFPRRRKGRDATFKYKTDFWEALLQVVDPLKDGGPNSSSGVT